ncbi:MAG: peroxiredoxin [Thermofilum sp.]|uniref:peroxiredoxin n=1 Tax=Thermofilum sp. TaxID=1961369 RepID=UPI00316012B2
MPVDAGFPAPDFEAESTKGKIRLTSLRGKRVVLYFYPKAFTPGCSRETQRFAEMYEKFKELNAEVIGVSADKLSTQEKFAQKYNVSFPLVADPELNIIRAYGVLSDSGKSASRVTFIIDENGVIKAVIKGLKKPEEHADKALNLLTAF